MPVTRYFFPLLLLLGTPSCQSAGGTAGPTDLGTGTGVQGMVVRGPTQPVCMVGVPCDAPFSASFSVQQAGCVVARFKSDEEGRFRVALQPGSYTVVPDDSAPILFPQAQSRTIEVGSGGYTTVTLEFDTGIR